MLARTPSLASVYEAGARKFPWWPDWRGHTVAIVASGHSVRDADLSGLRGRCKVLAIKKTWELCTFADAVYGCDGAWWRSVAGLPKFKGLKLTYDQHVPVQWPDIKRVEIRDKFLDRLIFEEPGSVGAGGNSGFQALNLVAQFGAERVFLFGFDAQDAGGLHWYGRNNWGQAANPDESSFKRWRAAFETAAVQLMLLKIDTINASPVSSLKGFRQMSIPQAIEALS